MTNIILSLLLSAAIGGATGLLGGWLFYRHRREPKPEPMEYQKPRVMTRIWDGNSTKEN